MLYFMPISDQENFISGQYLILKILQMFSFSEQSALRRHRLVKKYRGSLSGEHGDGRLRGEFIPLMLGEHNYDLLKQVKECWDPENILNPGKIIDTPAMNSSLRYIPGKATREIETIYDFSSSDGIIRAAERCNGSADCRKSVKNRRSNVSKLHGNRR